MFSNQQIKTSDQWWFGWTTLDDTLSMENQSLFSIDYVSGL